MFSNYTHDNKSVKNWAVDTWTEKLVVLHTFNYLIESYFECDSCINLTSVFEGSWRQCESDAQLQRSGPEGSWIFTDAGGLGSVHRPRHLLHTTNSIFTRTQLSTHLHKPQSLLPHTGDDHQHLETQCVEDVTSVLNATFL